MTEEVKYGPKVAAIDFLKQAEPVLLKIEVALAAADRYENSKKGSSDNSGSLASNCVEKSDLISNIFEKILKKGHASEQDIVNLQRDLSQCVEKLEKEGTKFATEGNEADSFTKRAKLKKLQEQCADGIVACEDLRALVSLILVHNQGVDSSESAGPNFSAAEAFKQSVVEARVRHLSR